MKLLWPKVWMTTWLLNNSCLTLHKKDYCRKPMKKILSNAQINSSWETRPYTQKKTKKRANKKTKTTKMIIKIKTIVLWKDKEITNKGHVLTIAIDKSKKSITSGHVAGMGPCSTLTTNYCWKAARCIEGKIQKLVRADHSHLDLL